MGLRGPPCPKHPSLLPVGVCSLCLKERLATLSELESQLADVTLKSHPINEQWPSLILHGIRPIATKHDVPQLVMNEVFDVYTTDNDPAIRAEGELRSVIDARSYMSTASPEAFRTDDEPRSVIGARSYMSTGSRKASGARDGSSYSKEARRVPPKCRRHAVPSDNINTHSRLPILINKRGDKYMSVENKMHSFGPSCEHIGASPMVMTSLDSRSNSSRSLFGARRSMSFIEPHFEAQKYTQPPEIQICDSSPNPRTPKKTLSSLFSLDDTAHSTSRRKLNQWANMHNVAGAKTDGPSSRASTTAHGVLPEETQPMKAMQSRFGHASFSERVRSSRYTLPIPENNKSRSWISSLFRRHKRRSQGKLVETAAKCSSELNGCELPRQSWEARRPSSWEGHRISSFEGPRSSWEPRKPPWDNSDLNTLDRGAFLRGFDFLSERFHDVRPDMESECQSFQDLRRSQDGFARKTVTPEVPSSVECDNSKDMARTFISSKGMQMQRDASTQTTPPRLSDAQEDFEHHVHHEFFNNGKLSNAVWNKLWNKRWVFKRKHEKGQDPNGIGYVGVAVAKDDKPRQSFQEYCSIDNTNGFNSFSQVYMVEHESWDACQNRSRSFRSVLDNPRVLGQQQQKLDFKSGTCRQEENVNDSRRRSIHLDNGVVKLYLTPINGHSHRAS